MMGMRDDYHFPTIGAGARALGWILVEDNTVVIADVTKNATAVGTTATIKHPKETR